MNIGKMTTIARPYVVAAFECAEAKKTLPAWSAMLTAAAQLTQDSNVQALLATPGISSADIADFYCAALSSCLDEEKTNFIRLLAENKRLAILPDIAQLFEEARAAREKTMNVEVRSAAPLDAQQQDKLAAALSKRLQQQVALQCTVDPELLGGVWVRAGDIVIDGSIRGKLDRLNEYI